MAGLRIFFPYLRSSSSPSLKARVTLSTKQAVSQEVSYRVQVQERVDLPWSSVNGIGDWTSITNYFAFAL